MVDNVMKLNIEWCLAQVKDERLRELSFKYLEILKKRGFDDAPASCGLHHSYKGGLRDHTEEMLFIGKAILDSCKFEGIDLDELMISIVFHDAGKADLYMIVDGKFEHNIMSRSTTIDHAFIPIVDWGELGLDFPENIKKSILGHMGGWSVTGIYPDTLMASIVSSADLISSRIGVTGW